MAATHAAVLRRTPGVDVIAVADPRGEAAHQLAAEFGAGAFTSLAQVLDSVPVDAVDIMVPHNLHHSLAKEALNAGVHVFMDKPIASTVPQARELCDIARRKDRVLAICHNLLFHPALQRTVEVIETGMLGRVTSATAWSSGWLDLAPWDFRLDKDATGGGAWVDGAPHLVYVLEACLGQIEKLQAILPQSSSRLGAEDTAVGQALFNSGAVATISVGYSDCPSGPDTDWPEGWRLGVNLIGTEGRLALDFLPRAQLTWQTKGQAERLEPLWNVPFDAGFEGAFSDFAAAVKGESTLRVRPEDSLRNLELIKSANDQ